MTREKIKKIAPVDNFNSHAHVERDITIGSACVAEFFNFNSHAHVERDAKVEENTYIHMDFNSHAHVERDGVFKIFVKFFTNFNSHAHVERDNDGEEVKVRFVISTHTLTWSVTLDK